MILTLLVLASSPSSVDAALDADPSSPTRALVTSGVALAVGSGLAAGLTAVGQTDCGAKGPCLIIGVPLSIGLVAMISWGVHKLMGGKTIVLWPLVGAFLGALTGGLGLLMLDLARDPKPGPNGNLQMAPLWSYLVSTVGFTGIGAGTMPEIGHFRAVRANAPERRRDPGDWDEQTPTEQ